MRDTRKDEGGIRDENILARSECAQMRDGFEIDSRMRDAGFKKPILDPLVSG